MAEDVESEVLAEQFAYVAVSETSIQLGLYVTGAGTSRVAPGSDYPDKGHPELYDFTWRSGRVLPEFQFVLVTEGRGEFETRELGLQSIVPGTMLILRPDTWHRYRPLKDTGWTEYWISANGDLMHDWQRRGLLAELGPVLHLDDSEILVRQYEEIIRLLKEHPRRQPTLASARAMVIITAAIDQFEPNVANAPNTSTGKFSPLVSDAINEVWSHSHQQISVAGIARKLHVAKRTLERAFLSEIGHGVHAELMRCRLERARRLLAETQVSIKSVAFASGFTSVSHMSRTFRRELDVSPTDYRETAVEQGNPGSRRKLIR